MCYYSSRAARIFRFYYKVWPDRTDNTHNNREIGADLGILFRPVLIPLQRLNALHFAFNTHNSPVEQNKRLFAAGSAGGGAAIHAPWPDMAAALLDDDGISDICFALFISITLLNGRLMKFS